MNNIERIHPAAALTAIRLRKRLRALSSGQAEAFDLLYYQFGSGSATGAIVAHAAARLPRLAALLADVAWTQGDHEAHDNSAPGVAPEAAEVKRVFRPHAHLKRRMAMNEGQQTAVLAYLDALLAEVACCIDLEEFAPSLTLGREARRFVSDFSEVRDAAAL